jgi:signal transduction histidine kinase
MMTEQSADERSVAMNRTPTTPGESPARSPNTWRWRLFPAFWIALLAIALVLNTLGLVANHPERLSGWRGAGLGVLLLGIVAAYRWLSWGRIYRDRAISARRALILVAVQLLALVLLVTWYDSSFGWLSLALLYQVIAGLPQRLWPLPLTGVLLVLVVGALPSDSRGVIDAGTILSSVVLFVVNLGIALFIRLLNDQRDQLHITLAQLQEAHARLAAGAAQQEELVVLRERARLARALHDNIGQALVVMNVKLEAAQLLYARDPTRGDAELEATRTLIRSTMTELRRALTNLRAPATPHDDLPAALQRLAHDLHARAGLDIRCVIGSDLLAAPAAAREALWYVAREALTNVERHAAAASATLSLDHTDDGWRLRVVDDGCGVTPAALVSPEHYGVMGMRERMQAIGGSLCIEPGASGGTIVEAYLPMHPTEETSAR